MLVEGELSEVHRTEQRNRKPEINALEYDPLRTGGTGYLPSAVGDSSIAGDTILVMRLFTQLLEAVLLLHEESIWRPDTRLLVRVQGQRGLARMFQPRVNPFLSKQQLHVEVLKTVTRSRLVVADDVLLVPFCRRPRP